jgi:hypothetical protein
MVEEGVGETRFTCWRHQLGTRTITLMFYGERHRNKGANLLITSEAAEYLGLAVSTVRSAADRHSIAMASMTDRREMDALKRIGAVQRSATKVAVMAVKGFGLAVRKVHNFDTLKLMEVEALSKAMPPPTRYLPGATHRPVHPATHGMRSPALLPRATLHTPTRDHERDEPAEHEGDQEDDEEEHGHGDGDFQHDDEELHEDPFRWVCRVTVQQTPTKCMHLTSHMPVGLSTDGLSTDGLCTDGPLRACRQREAVMDLMTAVTRPSYPTRPQNRLPTPLFLDPQPAGRGLPKRKAVVLRKDPVTGLLPNINPPSARRLVLPAGTPAAFPNTLPVVRLTPTQEKECYGLGQKVPRHIAAELHLFEDWSTRDFQLDRGVRYASAVAQQTFTKQCDAIKGYLGFVYMYSDRELSDLGLSAYAEPQSFASFVAYLLARRVGRGHLAQHISLARKVNTYLTTGADVPQETLDHAEAMDRWLATLDAQVAATMPKANKKTLPDPALVFAWVDGLIAGAFALIKRDQDVHNCLTWLGAWQVQAAIVASLVTGSHMPPCRLAVIKSLLHPAFNGRKLCLDPDCKEPDTCFGNHIKVIGGLVRDAQDPGSSSAVTPHTARAITFHAPHHKTEHRGFAPIEFKLPEGELTDLLLLHIEEGHKLLTQATGDECVSLFVTRTGKPFSDSNFTQYWDKVMTSAPPELSYFPPVLARTVFVEDYTSATGRPPNMWDGAAAIMGNSVPTWEACYNPSARKRRAQQAVDNHVELLMARRQRQLNDGMSS